MILFLRQLFLSSPNNKTHVIKFRVTAEEKTIAALILAIIGTCFLIKGFHVKNVYKNYSSSDYYYDYDDNVNAYVGGDAYNYIINGTYFAGFMALTGTMYLCATGLFCTSLLLNNKKQTVEVRPTSATTSS